MMTHEKAEQIAEYLNADESRAQKMIEAEASEAAAMLKVDGIEITADELKEFGEMISKQQTAGELDEAALEGVSGGNAWGPILIGPVIISWIISHRRW